MFKFKVETKEGSPLFPPNASLCVKFGEFPKYGKYYEYRFEGETITIVDRSPLANRDRVYFSINSKHFDESNVILDAPRKGLCQFNGSVFRLDRDTTITVESVVSSGRRLIKVPLYKNHDMSPLQVVKATGSRYVQVFSNALDAYNLGQTEGAQDKTRFVIVSITQHKEVYTIFYRRIK